MNIYKTGSNYFFRRTCLRVTCELFAFILIASYFWSELSKELPIWLKLSVLAVFAAYILFGLAFYPKSKAFAEKFTIQLLDNAIGFPNPIGFPNQKFMRQISYSDLTILNVIKKNDEVVEIRLITTFNQTIKLKGFVNMEKLYEDLSSRIITQPNP